MKRWFRHLSMYPEYKETIIHKLISKVASCKHYINQLEDNINTFQFLKNRGKCQRGGLPAHFSSISIIYEASMELLR